MKVNFVHKNKNIPNLENLPDKIWLSWKHRVPSTMTCLTKLFPDRF